MTVSVEMIHVDVENYRGSLYEVTLWMANFVILWDHHAMRISPYTLHLRKERGLSVSLITHFAVIQTKTCGSLVSTLSKTSYDKTAARKRWSLSKSIFWTSKQPFAIYFLLATWNFPPLAIPQIFAQTQGSDHWQLIHEILLHMR